MEFQEAIIKLNESQHFPRNATLSRMKEAIKRLNHPEKNLNFIHIAGTNGKGSVGALIKAGLKREKKSVGSFVSPHLIDITERITIDNEQISKEDFALIYTEVFSKTADIDLSFFEQLTLIALAYFAEKKPDYIIWETGLGGRLDATTVVDPLISVITPIGLDHTKFLGEDLYSIAKEKSFIIKPKTSVVVAPQRDGLEDIFLERAKTVGAKITLAKDFLPIDLKMNGLSPAFVSFPKLKFQGVLPLLGRHQGTNALCAYLALRELGVRELNSFELFSKAYWPGRLQYFPFLDLLVDGAHNEQAMESFMNFWKEERLAGKLIFATMGDKDYFTMVKQIDGYFEKVYLPKMNNKRAVAPETLTKLFKKTPCIICENLEEALELSVGKGFLALVGSLYLVGECLAIIEHKIDIKKRSY